ncbi:hypothetical protein PhCBS80983_g04316 [Powellomyces hirtus]|uniref:Band 7 domain-containing protein n=1 Tax=Powellomyces hirtus TaxID=109895 RepID=A0A507DY55_9FUNG|nr:hypothetical protein PhCBS80983_g04316 [Powellomyces hirtus]
MWHVASANEYIVVTGAGIADLKLAKKCYVWPLQKATTINITPRNFTLSLNAMSAEKLEFSLPAVFTIGVRDEPAELLKYARLLALADKGSDHIQELVRGVIEGETRVIAASMTMEEIFKERKFFKENVIKHVQAELDQFGLFIYNANVKQLTDTQGSEYFQYLRLKSHEGAVNQAKIDVANARYLGNVGEKEREGQTRKESSRVEASAVIFEAERKGEMAAAQASLEIKQTEYAQGVKIAQIETEKAASLRDAELQREVETKRALVEQERLRADKLAKAKVEAETILAGADAALYKEQRAADARLYAAQRDAEAVKAMYAAQADGLAQLAGAFNNNPAALMQYLMLEKGLYQDLARTNAEAIKGLQPKITVWNTGGEGNEGSMDPMAPIRNIFQALPPLLTTINDQTGITPPSWMAGLGAAAHAQVAPAAGPSYGKTAGPLAEIAPLNA